MLFQHFKQQLKEKSIILFPQVEIKEEQFSDSEEERRYKNASTIKTHKSSDSSDSSSSEDDDNEPSVVKKIKKEKITSSSSSSGSGSGSGSGSESDSDDDTKKFIPQIEIKKEKISSSSSSDEEETSASTFITTKIKSEPMSDVESIRGGSTFKKPSSANRRSLNANQKSEAPKRKHNSSLSEHLDSIDTDFSKHTSPDRMNGKHENKRSKAFGERINR